jgi:hypothetical protein
MESMNALKRISEFEVMCESEGEGIGSIIVVRVYPCHND